MLSDLLLASLPPKYTVAQDTQSYYTSFVLSTNFALTPNVPRLIFLVSSNIYWFHFFCFFVILNVFLIISSCISILFLKSYTVSSHLFRSNISIWQIFLECVSLVNFSVLFGLVLLRLSKFSFVFSITTLVHLLVPLYLC